MSALPISRHFDCMKRCAEADPVHDRQPCATRCKRWAAQSSTPVKLTIEVNPAHLESLDLHLVMLDTALGNGIERLRLKAAGGNREAMKIVDDMRASQRYVGDLSNAISAAQKLSINNGGNET
jgi:hypothetical protein